MGQSEESSFFSVNLFLTRTHLLEVSASIGIAWRHLVLLRLAAATRKTASDDNQLFC